MGYKVVLLEELDTLFFILNCEVEDIIKHDKSK